MAKILVSYRGAPRIRTWETGAFLAKAFRQLGHEVTEYANIYETNQWVSDRSAALNGEYDLHVFCEKNDGEPQYTELISVPCKRKVAWLFDTEMYIDFNMRLVGLFDFDHLLMANPIFLKRPLGGRPASFLPYAADKDAFYRPLETPKVRDLVLIGTDRPERRKLIKTLQRAGINAELITGIFKENYINALAESRIVLNDQAGGGGDLLSMRCFETLAAGSVLLQVNVSQDNLNVINPESCSIIYDNHESCIAEASRILNDDFVYSNTRFMGQNHVLREHTYVNRAKEILHVASIKTL